LLARAAAHTVKEAIGAIIDATCAIGGAAPRAKRRSSAGGAFALIT